MTLACFTDRHHHSWASRRLPGPPAHSPSLITPLAPQVWFRTAGLNVGSSGSSRNSSSRPPGRKPRLILPRGRQAHLQGPPRMSVQTPWASQIPTAPSAWASAPHHGVCPSPFGVRPPSPLCPRRSGRASGLGPLSDLSALRHDPRPASAFCSSPSAYGS